MAFPVVGSTSDSFFLAGSFGNTVCGMVYPSAGCTQEAEAQILSCNSNLLRAASMSTQQVGSLCATCKGFSSLLADSGRGQQCSTLKQKLEGMAWGTGGYKVE